MKILVVDDRTENLYLLETMLKRSGYEVVTALNGAEALEKLRGGNFDMIISDILMPVMDGFQLCRKVKTDKNLRGIPFIFYTATYTDEKDEEAALKMGADRFIRKPAQPDELIKIIQGVIGDIEKGEIIPGTPAVEEDKDVFKLYSERLVNKLERKVLDLEREISERKRVEEQVQTSLREKEILLREIHHRVKNNLQIISSILDLTIIRTENQKVISVFTDTKAKIQTMALIHSQLYTSKRFDNIDIGKHTRQLITYLTAVYGEKKKIIPIIEISDVHLSITQATPFALVLNELISNAFKHAFGEEDEGTIKISIHRSQDTIFTRIKDNGTSIPEEIDIYKTRTLGLKLVRNIVWKQLNGKLQLKRDKGSEFIIEFKILKEESDV